MRKTTHVESVSELLETLEAFEGDGKTIYVIDAKYPTPKKLRWIIYYGTQGLAFVGAQSLIGFWLTLLLFLAVAIVNAVHKYRETKRILDKHYKVDQIAKEIDDAETDEESPDLDRLLKALENAEHIVINTQILKIKTQ